MESQELDKAAKYFYGCYKKGMYLIKNVSDKMKEAVELLQAERFMNDHFWLRLDGNNVYIETYGKNSKNTDKLKAK